MILLAGAIVAAAVSVQGCVGTIVGGAVGATGKVAGATLGATTHVAGAALGGGRKDDQAKN
jgi:hypothetical protein